jgi:hypothetical protein
MALQVIDEAEHHAGCLVCGEALEYLGRSEPMTCATCGAAHPSSARCQAGHFVCDACHGASAKDLIEAVCGATGLTDPVQLAAQLMRHPAVKLHGPEHHYLVPSVLLAAWTNARGEPDAKRALLAEARVRSEPILGGFCGRQGACGAAIGTGIFASLATGATPLSTTAWRLSNELTAEALALVARHGGPRCCKRDTLLTVLAAARFARAKLGVALPARGVACEWTEQNAECIRSACPFHREPEAAAGA